MKRDTLKEDKALMLKFNRGFYRPQSIDQTAKEFKKTYGREIDFVVKKDKKFIEVKIIVDSAVKEKIGEEDKSSSSPFAAARVVDEFANYALFLNAK